MAWVESTLQSGNKHFRDALGNSGKADHVAIRYLFRGGKPDAASLGIYRLLVLVRTGEDLESPKDIGMVLNNASVIFSPPPPSEGLRASAGESGGGRRHLLEPAM